MKQATKGRKIAQRVTAMVLALTLALGMASVVFAMPYFHTVGQIYEDIDSLNFGSSDNRHGYMYFYPPARWVNFTHPAYSNFYLILRPGTMVTFRSANENGVGLQQIQEEYFPMYWNWDNMVFFTPYSYMDGDYIITFDEIGTFYLLIGTGYMNDIQYFASYLSIVVYGEPVEAEVPEVEAVEYEDEYEEEIYEEEAEEEIPEYVPTPEEPAATPEPIQEPAPVPVTIDLATASNWAHANLTQAVSLGLVPEALQSNFTNNITRAEFASMATVFYETITGREITGRVTFTDTNDVNVQKMAYVGVVQGVGDNRFDPNAQLTREQAAAMLVRLAEAIGQPLPSANASFADNDSISQWAVGSVGQVQSAEIMGGVGSNMFAPQEPYTREQSIITMLRMYELLN